VSDEAYSDVRTIIHCWRSRKPLPIPNNYHKLAKSEATPLRSLAHIWKFNDLGLVYVAVANGAKQHYLWCTRRALAATLLLHLSTEVCDSQSLTQVDFAAARRKMVEEQIAASDRGITNRKVLDVMGSVPRHEFVPESERNFAYRDEPLPIGYGQTISQPSLVAFMTDKLDLKPTDCVLEIGTGSGYQAAILSQLAAHVYTIEIIEPLARRAMADLKRLGYNNVEVLIGDGYKGWPEHAPFDAVIVTCAPDRVPQPLVDQLRDGGRMVIPVGAAGNQSLYLLEKHGESVVQQSILPVRFVPMTGKMGADTGE
jgi:protein-L-isoaspartate(D-aspartate) O-methyltransferase